MAKGHDGADALAERGAHSDRAAAAGCLASDAGAGSVSEMLGERAGGGGVLSALWVGAEWFEAGGFAGVVWAEAGGQSVAAGGLWFAWGGWVSGLCVLAFGGMG